MITLSNRHSFEYMTASGAMGYDGKGWLHEQALKPLGLLDISLFTHVMKSVTLKPRKGNYRWWKPWDTVRLIWRDSKIVGVGNVYGLSQQGFDWWAKKFGPEVDSKKVKLIGSIFGEPGELAVMARRMNDFDLVGLEYNTSCPNSQDDTLSNPDKVIRSCELIKEATRHPLLVKLSVVHDIKRIVPKIESIVEVFDINSVPWNTALPKCFSPFTKYGGGGVSGKIAQPFTWPFAATLQHMTRRPVIAPSIWDYQDIATMRENLFRAYSFGSVFLPYPWRPTLFAKQDKKDISLR